MLITRQLQRIRQKVPNDGDTPDVYLNARDKIRITTFYTIVDKLATVIKYIKNPLRTTIKQGS